MKLENIILPIDTSKRFDVEIQNNAIDSMELISSNKPSPSFLLPTFCHPHIHLDKAFLLTSNNNDPSLPDYSDLVPETGDFKEAIEKTGAAKTRYTHADLICRGSQLIAESIKMGVTSMRAFVEVDHVTRFKCIEAAIELKQRFQELCHVQICVFAQDPVCSTEHGEVNRHLMEEALQRFREHVDVIGSTPYVEQNVDHQKENIEWAVGQALKCNLHLDFHLDFNIDSKTEAMVWYVVRTLKKEQWSRVANDRTVVLGHCTRLTLFSQLEWEKLAKDIGTLPVHFVGLPTSDVFMARTVEDNGENRPRGTLQVLRMIRNFGLKACIGVNNVGNAFTPWGNLDPLRLSSLGVGIYQAGTPDAARLLFECISSRAREAIGLDPGIGIDADSHTNQNLRRWKGPFLLIKNVENIDLPEMNQAVLARQRLDIKDLVWDPPESGLRQLVFT